MPTRRSFLLSALAAPLVGASRVPPERSSAPSERAPPGTGGRASCDAEPPRDQVGAARRAMRLCLHQNTSSGAGFRGSLEGWARAGIRNAELSDRLLDGFLETDTLAGARALLSDLGITPVSGAAVIADLWMPGPDPAAALDRWRLRCEQYAAIGMGLIYCPSLTTRPVTAEQFRATPNRIWEVGEVAAAHGLTAMVEFTRTSRHLATLASTVRVIREAGHPAVRPMLDFFHFWSGLSKMSDLDLLDSGELAHAHFQDVLDVPRELVDNDARLIPGDGIAPVVQILRELDDKRYVGALSVELFRAELVQGDPYEVAREIRRKCEAVMSEAGVL